MMNSNKYYTNCILLRIVEMVGVVNMHIWSYIYTITIELCIYISHMDVKGCEGVK